MNRLDARIGPGVLKDDGEANRGSGRTGRGQRCEMPRRNADDVFIETGEGEKGHGTAIPDSSPDDGVGNRRT